jgi:hypothetical protein
MADTAVAITAGSGTNIDTRTEGTNGNHRQVVVIGDPATNANVAAVTAASTAAAAGDPALVVAISPNGEVAHDAVDAGGGSKIAAKAIAGLFTGTPVAAADRTDLFAGLDGALIVRPHCGLEDLISGNASNTDGTSTQVIAAAGAGVKQYLTSVTITNMHATTVVYVELKSGTTVMYTLPVPPGGATVSFPVPLKPNAANEAWNFDASAAVTTLYCSMVGFKSKV